MGKLKNSGLTRACVFVVAVVVFFFHCKALCLFIFKDGNVFLTMVFLILLMSRMSKVSFCCAAKNISTTFSFERVTKLIITLDFLHSNFLEYFSHIWTKSETPIKNFFLSYVSKICSFFTTKVNHPLFCILT